MTQSYPVLPLRDIVVFPQMIVPLFVGRDKSVAALESAMAADKQIFLVSQLDPAEDDPDRDALYDMGVVATVLQLLKLPDGTVRVLVEGQQRANLVSMGMEDQHLVAEVEAIEVDEPEGAEVAALMRSVVEQFENYSKLNRKLPAETAVQLGQIGEASKLANSVAANINIKVSDKQALLAELNPVRRLEMVFAFMEGELGVLQVEKRIRSRVKRQMEKTQREYYLNEQLKAIQRELGNEGEEGEGDELAELARKIAKTKLSQGGADQGDLRDEEAEGDGADVGRGHRQPQLSRRPARPALGQEVEGQEGHRRGPGDPRRGPLRAREGQGPDRRISRRPGPDQQAEGADPVPRRPSRGRQDLARPLDRPGDRPRVRPPVAGRSARRGRDPRPPPHLYRLAARQDRLEPEEGRHLEPALPARRDRQARPGFPRRSRLGPARGARSGAEFEVPGPLSRDRLRPLRRHVRHHGEHDGHASASARPDGDHPPRRLYRGREGRDRPPPPHPQADRIARAEGRASWSSPRTV